MFDEQGDDHFAAQMGELIVQFIDVACLGPERQLILQHGTASPCEEGHELWRGHDHGAGPDLFLRVHVLRAPLFEECLVMTQIDGDFLDSQSGEKKGSEVRAQRLDAQEAGQDLADVFDGLRVVICTTIAVSIEEMLDHEPDWVKHGDPGNADHQGQ